MCGITGFFDLGLTPNPEIILLRMTNALIHRGPDDSGLWIDGLIALGHRRLSILDLSPAGHQPMVSACGRYVMVFNGEIYNHQALRAELEKSADLPIGGWRGHSDTETILAYLAAQGLEAMLKATVGMFALAVWDRSERCLYLARDRLGEKPLYYGWQKDVFLFGSELKALCIYPKFQYDIDWDVAARYLRTNYIATPDSIYKGIRKLPAGMWLKLDMNQLSRQLEPAPKPYWSLAVAARQGRESPFQGTLHEATDELEQLLTSAVQYQAIADVPVGAFLSGGIDSSTVVALMQKSTTTKVTTFSIGMPLAKMDESKHAAAVARHLGTNHVEHQISPEEALAIIPQLPGIWDEPFADSSAIPTYLVSQLARQQVTVALSGDGGDEFFFGYSQYALLTKLWRTRWLGYLPWAVLFAGRDAICGHRPDSARLRKARSVVAAWKQTDPQALNRYWMDRYRGGPVPVSSQSPFQPLLLMPNLDHVAATMSLYDAATYLPDDILAKVDRAAMAVSLETRAPLLDHRLVEFALRLPEQLKSHNSVDKRVLREVLYRYVPKKLVDRPKQGFSIPLADWLRNELRPWVESTIDAIQQDSGPWNTRMINQLWSEHRTGMRDRTEQIWGLLMLGGFVEHANNRLSI